MTAISLAYPIDRDGQTIASVTVRRPTGGDMVAIGDHLPTLMALAEGGNASVNASTFSAMIAVAGSLSGLGEDASKLDLEDLQSVVEAGLATMGNSQTGGETPG